MDQLGGTVDDVIIIASRPFPFPIEAYREVSIGQPCQGTAARQALEVDDPIEALGAHPSNGVPESAPIFGPSPAAAFEGDEPSQIRVVLEQGGQAGVNPPVDIAFGELAL